MINIKYLKQAINLAKKSKGTTSPNPVVGAIIVKNNKIISQGVTQKAGSNHAEVEAIKNSVENLSNSTLYITMEPCCFYGQTPACTEIIIKSGIKKVVIGVKDPNPKVNGKGVKILKEAKIEVNCGFLEEEIKKINEDFNKYIICNIPFITVKYAMSLDGKIATYKNDSKWISNEMSRLEVQKLRKINDCILVGVNTIIQDNPRLTYRPLKENKDIKVNQPLRVILDSNLNVPIDSNILNDENPCLIVVKSSVSKLKKYDQIMSLFSKVKNKEIIIDKTKQKLISLEFIISEIKKRNKISLLIEGGSEILTSAMQENIVDKIICFIAPKIIMGKLAPGPFEGNGFEKIKDVLQLKNVVIKPLEDNVMISGYTNASKCN